MGNEPIALKQNVDFSVYGLDFAADDTLIIGGGGGPNNIGFKNNLVKDYIHLKVSKEK